MSFHGVSLPYIIHLTHCPSHNISKIQVKHTSVKSSILKNSPTQALRNSQSLRLILFLICLSFLKSTSRSSLLPIPAPDASSILWKSMFTSDSRFNVGGDLLWLLLQLPTPPTTPPTPWLTMWPTTALLLSLSWSSFEDDCWLSGSDASSMGSASRLLGVGWSHTTHLRALAQFS